MNYINKKPLAELLRPQNFDDFLGQEHLTGQNGIIRKMVAQKALQSIILWGPPGSGKTTLAMIITEAFSMNFAVLSAVTSGVKDVRNVIDSAKLKGNIVLFIDEIHRFNKSQQDSLLSAVEKGIITLIGATIENPSFEVISPLLSRCLVYVLKPLEEHHTDKLIERAVSYVFENYKIEVEIAEKDALIRLSDGDARKLYNILDIAIMSNISDNKVVVTNQLIKDTIMLEGVKYDKGGEYHYDIISAFIKSIRGSDPNAAVYWLARMISGGEDPLFIARRMIILASEDIGNANPNALLLATSCFDAVHKIGMPESKIVLSQTAIYLACSQKSNASYLAIEQALDMVKKTGNLPVPLHIRNAPTKLMKELNYGKDYKYSHDFENNFVAQDYLPEKIKNEIFYNPQQNNKENEIRRKLKKMWKGKYDY